MGGGTRRHLRPECAAGSLPHHGRGPELGARAVRQRPGRRGRPGARSRQSRRRLRRHLAGGPPPVGNGQRRRGQRPAPHPRRRPDLAADERIAGLPDRTQGPHRGRHLPGRPRPDLCGGRGRRRRERDLSQRQPRRHLDPGEPGDRADRAALVLQPHLRRSPRRGHGLDLQPVVLALPRRRRDLHPGADAARGQPRPLARPGRPAPDGAGQRRWCLRVLQRGPHLLVGLQPVHRADLSGRHRPGVPVRPVRHPAGQLGDPGAVAVVEGGDPLAGLPGARRGRGR